MDRDEQIGTPLKDCVRPSHAELVHANVNPNTLLATDYLNLFNEYIMLAGLVAEGSFSLDDLGDWMPVSYEHHFEMCGFAGAQTVVLAYKSMDDAARDEFDAAADLLVSLIVAHQTAPDPKGLDLTAIEAQRDLVATLISGTAPGTSYHADSKQAEIDALFD